MSMLCLLLGFSFLSSHFSSCCCFWTDWQKFFRQSVSVIFADISDQDQGSFIGQTGKIVSTSCNFVCVVVCVCVCSCVCVCVCVRVCVYVVCVCVCVRVCVYVVCVCVCVCVCV